MVIFSRNLQAPPSIIFLLVFGWYFLVCLLYFGCILLVFVWYFGGILRVKEQLFQRLCHPKLFP